MTSIGIASILHGSCLHLDDVGESYEAFTDLSAHLIHICWAHVRWHPKTTRRPSFFSRFHIAFHPFSTPMTDYRPCRLERVHHIPLRFCRYLILDTLLIPCCNMDRSTWHDKFGSSHNVFCRVVLYEEEIDWRAHILCTIFIHTKILGRHLHVYTVRYQTTTRD